jgi:hypothetical protein
MPMPCEWSLGARLLGLSWTEDPSPFSGHAAKVTAIPESRIVATTVRMTKAMAVDKMSVLVTQQHY